MKVKSFLASKATSIDTVSKDLQEIEAKIATANMNSLPVIVVNNDGLKDLKAYTAYLDTSHTDKIEVQTDFIPSQVGTFCGRVIFLEEDSNIKMRILTVTPSIILSEWVEGK